MKIKKKKGSKQLTKENTHVVPNKKRVREKAKQSEEKSINSAFTSTIPLHFILRTRKQGPLWDVKSERFFTPSTSFFPIYSFRRKTYSE